MHTSYLWADLQLGYDRNLSREPITAEIGAGQILPISEMKRKRARLITGPLLDLSHSLEERVQVSSAKINSQF
jgi:hypothetical protein